jgi:undecaprenyl-diphosphatase
VRHNTYGLQLTVYGLQIFYTKFLTMTLIQSIILGLIQGFTEFIPVSSSGHLVLIPELFGWEVQSTSFDITIHAATLLALIIYFRRDLAKLVTNFRKEETKKLLLNLIIVSIPAGIIGLLFEDFIDQHFKSVWIIAIMLILLGIVFILVDNFFKKTSKTIDKLSTGNTLIIGIAQAIAFIRGTSRSGITMLGGLISGLTNKEAAKFSFLAGIPIMTVVVLKQLVEFSIEGLGELDMTNLLIGFSSAFISGLLAIKFMLSFLKTKGLSPFGIYRIILGIIILIVLL